MKILVVPLFPRQYEWLKGAYKGPHEIEYLDSAKGESPNVLETKAKRADKVVVLTKFISHSHWDKIPRDKLIHIDSVNIDRLVTLLDGIPKDGVQSAPVRPRAQVIRKEDLPVRKPAEPIPQRAIMSTSTTREVRGGFVLTTAVPVPGPKSSIKMPEYPLDLMEVGESFWIETKDKDEQRVVAGRISVAANYQRKKNPKLRFKTTVKQPGGVRCWRLPDRDPNEVTANMRPKKKK